ncbi:sigma-54-dependent transcriptional regulator [Thermodesulforhabdus norvegica]|uniref:Regulatory protein, Fis family n=1 Tax=Thermodesulforhabdus norvegica TaxID=39841 RepID=A0A1I4QYG8_9BACT|nr:sigma-54 dependent transcriptional regulator [Thermodesulforhabdus norvegica]SFM45069.1 regulatory protein, Fis family [Thermodesulforhabdus norvegica]
MGKNQPAILIVDDEIDFIRLLERLILEEVQCEIYRATSGYEAVEILKNYHIDLAFVDIKMPGMDGFELLSYVRENHPWLTVIMITAYGCIEVAVRAIKEGAYDFITKPVEQDVFLMSLKKALERTELLRENLRLRQSVRFQEVFRNIVGRSEPMRKVFDLIRMVAPTDMTVLLRGESGTGKELLARAIHELSSRSDGPFVAVNCPAVPAEILESELFGYRKGAFTHATQNKKGLFEEAQKGTIFLDEIGDLDPRLQTKLLRVLQEKEIKPLGDTRTIRVDVRVVASTNQDLEQKMKDGTFREDLFYRLNVVPIHVPPLRERREDIPLLVEFFLEKYSRELKRPRKRVTPELMEIFLGYEWKGNIRELENTIIRGILFSVDDEIRPEHIGFARRSNGKPWSTSVPTNLSYREAREAVLHEFHHRFIGQILKKTGGNISQAARMCGLERQALQHIIKRYNIDVNNYRPDRREQNGNGL